MHDFHNFSTFSYFHLKSWKIVKIFTQEVQGSCKWWNVKSRLRSIHVNFAIWFLIVGNTALMMISITFIAGLLSLFEHYDSIVVGDHLKTPVYPIWLICSESHFTVLFGLQFGLERTSMADRRPIGNLL